MKTHAVSRQRQRKPAPREERKLPAERVPKNGPMFEAPKAPAVSPAVPRPCPFKHPSNITCPQCCGFPID